MKLDDFAVCGGHIGPPELRLPFLFIPCNHSHHDLASGVRGCANPSVGQDLDRVDAVGVEGQVALDIGH
jgi:hypothetical protein